MKSSTPAASMFYKGRAILNGLRLKLELRGSLAVLLGLLSRRLRSKMPTPSLGGREPPVDKVAGGPRTSITSESDFYTAWCRMYSHELFTPTTSAVPTVWDAFFHPPPPPPPPPPAPTFFALGCCRYCAARAAREWLRGALEQPLRARPASGGGTSCCGVGD